MNNNTKKIIYFYENLNFENLNSIDQIYSNDCYFKDPFHTFRSIHELTLLYAKMFKRLDNPKFVITKYFEHENEIVLFWDFTCNKNFKISGNSLLTLNSSNKVNSHIDYWDSINEIWLKVPIIGNFIRFFYKIII